MPRTSNNSQPILTFSYGGVCVHGVLDLEPEPLYDGGEVCTRGRHALLEDGVHSLGVEHSRPVVGLEDVHPVVVALVNALCGEPALHIENLVREWKG